MTLLKSLFFLILGMITIPGLVPWLLLQASGGVPPLALSIWLVGLPPLLGGLGLFLWCNGAFTFVGRGTLAPISAPIFLVRSGPYQKVRNPMYLALFLMIGGEVLLFHSLWLAGYLLLLIGTVHLFVVRIEEPQLLHQYGESYQNYLHSVPRWLPRFPPLPVSRENA